MQPYAFAYLGYFQLIHAADKLILLDDAAYIKQGWINRNMLAGPGGVQRFTFPVKAPHTRQTIADMRLHEADRNRAKFLKTIDLLYRKAPYYGSIRPIVERAISTEGDGLAESVACMIETVCSHLGITTPMVRASGAHAGLGGQGQERVIAMCKAEGASTYVNAEGGVSLYDEAVFRKCGLELRFLKHIPVLYAHFCDPFRPRLSIIDVMMFNSSETIARMLQSYVLVRAQEID